MRAQNPAGAALADQPFPTLHADVAQRIAFADCVAAGKLVWEVSPKGAAAREIAALAQAVLGNAREESRVVVR